MYTKYYIEATDKMAKKWVAKEENSNKIVGNFTSKELALQFIHELCKDSLYCTIIVNDKSTYSISLDNM